MQANHQYLTESFREGGSPFKRVSMIEERLQLDVIHTLRRLHTTRDRRLLANDRSLYAS